MARFDKDVRCREIITQAVCGTGSKYSQTTHTIHPANRPSSIGGCWVMNHSFKAELIGEFVEIHGRFDVNVWYSYNGNSETAVAKDTVSYVEQIPLRDVDPNCFRDEMEVVANVVQIPNCLDAAVTDNGKEIIVRVEKELSVEVIGKTKVFVVVCDPPNKKEEEDIIEEEVFEEEEDFED